MSGARQSLGHPARRKDSRACSSPRWGPMCSSEFRTAISRACREPQTRLASMLESRWSEGLLDQTLLPRVVSAWAVAIRIEDHRGLLCPSDGHLSHGIPIARPCSVRTINPPPHAGTPSPTATSTRSCSTGKRHLRFIQSLSDRTICALGCVCPTCRCGTDPVRRPA
jgi:hypothetical protein